MAIYAMCLSLALFDKKKGEMAMEKNMFFLGKQCTRMMGYIIYL